MARATVNEIADEVKVKLPESSFVLSEDDANCFTIYPPKSYFDDFGVDVFLEGNQAELWRDGFKMKTVKSIQKADLVADEIIKVIEEFEGYYKKDNEV